MCLKRNLILDKTSEDLWTKAFENYKFDEARLVKRNKTEFTFGEDPQTKEIQIGYFISRNEEKQEWTIGRDRNAGNNSVLSHQIADLFQSILNQEKKMGQSEVLRNALQPYNYYTKEGCFRYCIIR